MTLAYDFHILGSNIISCLLIHPNKLFEIIDLSRYQKNYIPYTEKV